MSRFAVKMGDVTVGWSDLKSRDSGMGIASGTFRPAPAYDLVQPILRLFAESHGETSAQPVDEAKLARYFAARDRLGLSLHAPDGKAIPTKFVHIADFTVEAGPESLQIDVAVTSPSAWQRLAGLSAEPQDA